jgi:1,4-dihydroxy-2-naphthoyl-CoA hydrolase
MKTTYRIRLADTDAAGRIYFASALRIAHESFEHFMEVIGFDVPRMLTTLPFALPVVRVEANYHASLKLGDEITVESKVSAVGKRSVTFSHTLITGKGRAAVDVTITHAVIAKKTGKSVAMPTALRKALTVG